MDHLTTAQIKEQVHQAIRNNDKPAKDKLLAEMNKRIAALKEGRKA